MVSVPHQLGFPAVTASPAFRAGNFHIREELHVQIDDPRAVADRAAELAGVVGKIPGLIPKRLRVRRPGKDLPQLVMDVGISGHGGAHVDADGGRVDQLHLPNALRLHSGHVFRQLFAVNGGV